jgi:ribose 5-phosphate isomerase
MKITTDTANTIKDILCRLEKLKFKKLRESLQWGIDNEEKAKQKLEEITGLCSCGLFVDIEKTFLGASPDGLVDLDSIVEIKCPFAARNTDIKTAIEFFFLNIWK